MPPYYTTAKNPWTLSLRTPVEFGICCLERLAVHLPGFRRALVVTGRHAMQAAGITDRIVSIAQSSGLDTDVFADISAEPTYQEVEAGGAQARSCGADVIIGCGGGSALDAAKAIAVAATHAGPIMDYVMGGPRQITAATLPIFAISSTSGTGSHVGRIAVLADRAQRIKRGLGSDYLFPRVAFCDPVVLRTMPPEVTAVTGFDAFAHALEGFLSSSENPLGKVCAREAMRIIIHALPQVMAHGDDLNLRAEMAWADTLAGISLATNAVVIPHVMGMVLGGRYGITHARAVATVTVAGLRHSRAGAIGKLADIARLLGCVEPTSDEGLADWAIEAIERFIVSIGLEPSIVAYGIAEGDFASIANEVQSVFSVRVKADPVPADAAGLTGILRASAQMDHNSNPKGL